MISLGWVEPWVAPFAWLSAIVGGAIFGAGMVVASTCITGLFYKLGHGMLGVLVSLITCSIGDILVYRGHLVRLRETLNHQQIDVEGSNETVVNLFSSSGWILLSILSLIVVVFLWRSPTGDRDKLWRWLPLGLATGLFTSVAWLLADWGGSNYTYGTSSCTDSSFPSCDSGRSTLVTLDCHESGELDPRCFYYCLSIRHPLSGAANETGFRY